MAFVKSGKNEDVFKGCLEEKMKSKVCLNKATMAYEESDEKKEIIESGQVEEEESKLCLKKMAEISLSNQVLDIEKKLNSATTLNGHELTTITELNRSSSLYSHSIELVNFKRDVFLLGPQPNNNFGPSALLASVQCTKDVNSFGVIDPSLQCLEWKAKPQNVLLVKKISDNDVSNECKKVIQWLIEEKGMTVIVEDRVLVEDNFLFDDVFSSKYLNKLLPLIGKNGKRESVDLIVCMGGDGTLLHVSSLFQGCCPPVISFHLGSMGFLAPFAMDNFRAALNNVLAADVGLQLRSRLKCQIRKQVLKGSRGNVEGSEIDFEYLVMNEVVIERGSSSVTNVEIYCNGRFITVLFGDGLIISTPTGSTAYSAAAGASMVHPSVPGIVLTPICPHSLSFRPIVLPAGVELKVLVSKGCSKNEPRCSFDGRYSCFLSKMLFLRVTTSVYPVPCISHQDHLVDWFESLAACLHWNKRETKRAHTS
ncbi:NAD kinase isoform X1 [Hydra vulgaris]|uniref:NAD kinase isoform X1 n=1 Tax=Hydra vulgaris TaxID=6087 RepID=UPI0006415FF2|nr:NAD kinase [Hydra vulgaris]